MKSTRNLQSVEKTYIDVKLETEKQALVEETKEVSRTMTGNGVVERAVIPNKLQTSVDTTRT